MAAFFCMPAERGCVEDQPQQRSIFQGRMGTPNQPIAQTLAAVICKTTSDLRIAAGLRHSRAPGPVGRNNPLTNLPSPLPFLRNKLCNEKIVVTPPNPLAVTAQ